MNKKFLRVGIFLTGFAALTWMLLTIDTAPIGPMGSVVGLSTLNRMFHSFTGVHMELYRISDLLSKNRFKHLPGVVPTLLMKKK